MKLNELYLLAVKNDKKAEQNLFDSLFVRFCIFVEQKGLERLDVEDIVQNSIAVILKKYKTVDFEYSFSAWAYGVLNKEILKYFKTKSRHKDLLEKNKLNISLISNYNPDPELRHRLFSCLEKLANHNLRYFEILALKYKGFDTDRISTQLDIKTNNLYVILNRARSLLKDCLEREIA